MKLLSQPSMFLLWSGVLLWVVLSGPAYWWGGRDGFLGLSLSAVLCILPGVVVLWLADRFFGEQTRVWAILAGSGLRLVVVVPGILVAVRWAGWGFRTIGVWAVIFYLFALAVETRLLTQSRAD